MAVIPTATAASTMLTPHGSSNWPAMRKPSGVARVLIEISAVIIFGRSSTGVRAVMMPITGPLTSGVNTIAVKSAAITPPAGRSSGSSHSGRVSATIAKAARRSGCTRLITATAARLPMSAPAPMAVKNSPAIFESPEKLS